MDEKVHNECERHFLRALDAMYQKHYVCIA